MNTSAAPGNHAFSTVRVEVDPRARLPYAWFYVHGFRALLGSAQVTWSTRWREQLPPAGAHSHDQYAAMVLDMGGTRRRVVVDFRDLVEFDEVAYEWADVYGKVNLAAADAARPKVLPLGPGFGVGPRLAERADARAFALGAMAHRADRRAGYRVESPPAAALIRDYGRWQTLPSLDSYRAAPAGTEQLFYAAKLWSHASTTSETDPERAAFMRAAKVIYGNGFSGGFVGGSAADRARYADLLLNRPVRRHAWIERTIASTVAFNNAAVWGCLGWKLGQYLALGKAIISTPLHNVLPEPLIHGRHLHVVGDPDEFPAAIEHLRTDGNYRRELERGALSYWHRWLAPKVVAARILTAAEST